MEGALPAIAPPEDLKFVATLKLLVTGRPFLGKTFLLLKEHPDAGALLAQVSTTASLNPGPGVTVTV